LAFGPTGHLYVVEETANRVSRIETDGSVTLILDDLDNPEGIASDEAGNLYIVEDKRAGRLIRLAPDGDVTILVDGLDAPEGVVVGPTGPDTEHPTLYLTESNVQFANSPLDLQTQITEVSPPKDRGSAWSTRPIIIHTPILSGSQIAFWSYAGIALGPDNLLYVTNELSGQKITRRIEVILNIFTYKATLATNDSIFVVDPNTSARTPIASGLLSPEGLSFSVDGGFPLYVAEESTRFDARLSQVGPDGQRTTVCGNLRGIEDVAVDPRGNLYVSEDRTGYVIQIRPTQSNTGNNRPRDGSTTVAPPQTGDTSAAPKNGEIAQDTSGFLRAVWNRLFQFVRGLAHLAQRLGKAPGSSGEEDSDVDKGLRTWDRAVVRNTGDQGLHCRTMASLDADIVHTLKEGTSVMLLRGPARWEGYVWWEVEGPDGEPCWAAEKWLYPLQ
jgi:sugar lactone lactonase YvrE